MAAGKIYTVTGILVLGIAISVVAMGAPHGSQEFTNLKVLPKDISSKDLQRIMVDDFQDGLGVSCNYCHAKEKDGAHLDYASDEKPEKEIARGMMRMVLEVNQKYFNVVKPMIGDSLLVISCNNCHQGSPHP